MRLQVCTIIGLIMAGSTLIGCNPERKDPQASRTEPKHHMRVISEETVPAAKASDSAPQKAGSAHPAKVDAQNNPTAASKRGEPSLDDKDRPAVWVYVDGKSGKFAEKAGQKLIQWMIEDTVSAKPTIRVEAFAPLLGVPTDFKCVLKTVQSNDGSYIDYRIAVKQDGFSTGREYNLLKPGDDFTIHNAMSGDVVKEIGPLHPGTYAIAVSLRNIQTGKESSGVSYFTVGAN
ncbi:MAG: hypothetical protein HY287_10955 [Planctomycetes bacterium]|nr:hypothetical protein [Planctomycetota bacterium]MBI3834836.1 hypothetical protein [Planctomycetota bacterium]